MRAAAFREEAIAEIAPDMKRMASEIAAEDVAALIPHLTAIRRYLDAARNPGAAEADR
jgi:hypothetical protein